MLCAKENNIRCLPFVLMPRKRKDADIEKKFKGQLELCWCGTNWMNGGTTIEFLKRVIGTAMFTKRMLVWDSFKCHFSNETKKELKKLNVDIAIVPGGM